MVEVLRGDEILAPDSSRVVARPFLPGEATFANGPTRVELIARRVLDMPDPEVVDTLNEVRARFAGRHRDLEGIWERHAAAAGDFVEDLSAIEGPRRLLLGAFFTQEYAPEGAALCNPSIVPMPGEDDTGRFIMSLRAIGEGHVSSVEFRTGQINDDGTVELDPTGGFLTGGAHRAPIYDNQIFTSKLVALNADPDLAGKLSARLPERFTIDEMEEALEAIRLEAASEAVIFETSHLARWFAASNYELVFPAEIPISERILLPAGPADSRGIEDARFVRFTEEDGSVIYYATYTAFDGFTILPQLIETSDFTGFRLATLNGKSAQNKGMALFPRRIDGGYAALGRHDSENLYLLHSDRLRVWDHADLLYSPKQGWENVQTGPCAPPLETERGWLVIIHGVGPMRTYRLGALLLDLDDPSRVIGHLESPFLEPNPAERDGYVPNVVYSCGAMIHAGWLVIPYAFSDRQTRFASVALDSLLNAMA